MPLLRQLISKDPVFGCRYVGVSRHDRANGQLLWGLRQSEDMKPSSDTDGVDPFHIPSSLRGIRRAHTHDLHQKLS
jgi:hypothetical protein